MSSTPNTHDDGNNEQLTLKVSAPNFGKINIDENKAEFLGAGKFARVFKIPVTINGLVQTVGWLRCTEMYTNTPAFSWL